MNFLSLQLRFLVPLVLTLVAAAYLALPLMDQLTLRWFARDLNIRGALVTNALSDSIIEARGDAKRSRSSCCLTGPSRMSGCSPSGCAPWMARCLDKPPISPRP